MDYQSEIKEIVLKQLQLLQDAAEKCDAIDLIAMSQGLSTALNCLTPEFYEMYCKRP